MLKSGTGRKAAVGAALASSTGAALACGACCILPLALPAVVVAGLGGSLAWASGSLPWITGVSLLAVGAGWVMVWRESRVTDRRASRLTLVLMSMSTAMLAVALAWPFIEKAVLAAVLPLLQR